MCLTRALVVLFHQIQLHEILWLKTLHYYLLILYYLIVLKILVNIQMAKLALWNSWASIAQRAVPFVDLHDFHVQVFGSLSLNLAEYLFAFLTQVVYDLEFWLSCLLLVVGILDHLHLRAVLAHLGRLTILSAYISRLAFWLALLTLFVMYDIWRIDLAHWLPVACIYRWLTLIVMRCIWMAVLWHRGHVGILGSMIRHAPLHITIVDAITVRLTGAVEFPSDYHGASLLLSDFFLDDWFDLLLFVLVRDGPHRLIVLWHITTGIELIDRHLQHVTWPDLTLAVRGKEVAPVHLGYYILPLEPFTAPLILTVQSLVVTLWLDRRWVLSPSATDPPHRTSMHAVVLNLTWVNPIGVARTALVDSHYLAAYIWAAAYAIMISCFMAGRVSHILIALLIF